ncbi:MAG: VWA domain-containing protein [Rhodospirillaceae bacterium]|nr:VWA domain-containing protein [Rhodospirillaceae bacterium]
MSFIWLTALWSLAALPLMVLGYVMLLRRQKRAAVRYPNLALVKGAMGAARWRRHVPPVLFFLAVAVILLAAARPQAFVTLPSQRSTLVLAMDVSGSMQAQDVAPNRITAAQAAAKAFVEQQPPDVRLGLVAYAGAAMLVQPPTFERTEILAAIARFTTQRGTNIGGGLLTSLEALFPDADFSDLQRGRDFRDRGSYGINALNSPRGPLGGAPLGSAPAPEKKEAFVPVAPGSYKNAAIILMTDGQATTGPNPVEAARRAAQRGVRVYTVGFGSPNGTLTTFDGFSMRVQLDEEVLKEIADITRGAYFRAETAAELTKVYQSLNAQTVLETTRTEITALFAAGAAALLLVAGVLSFLWFGRMF